MSDNLAVTQHGTPPPGTAVLSLLGQLENPTLDVKGYFSSSLSILCFFLWIAPAA